MVNSKTITKGGIGTTTASFTVDLDKPGSSAVYDLTVENKGTIDAILTSIEGLDESNANEPVDIVYDVIDLEEGEILTSGASKRFQVKVVWNVSATSVPTTSKSLILKLNYEQKTGISNLPTVSINDLFLDSELMKSLTTGNERSITLFLDGITGVEDEKDVAYNLTVTSSNPSVLHIKNNTLTGRSETCNKYENEETHITTFNCSESINVELVGPGTAIITVIDASNGTKITETYTITEDDFQVITGDFKLDNYINNFAIGDNHIGFEIVANKTSSDYQFNATSSDPSICEVTG